MKKLPLALAVLVLIILAVLVYRETTTESPQASHAYTSEIYAFSFSYPEGYVLSEREVGNAHRAHYAITLTRAEDVAVPEGGEGPTGITIDVYQNNLDQQTLLAWLTGGNDSNYKLGDGTYASTTVDDTEAIRYSWSGLYEGETTAFRHAGGIVAVTVTRLAPDDHTETYESVLASFELYDPDPISAEEAARIVKDRFADLAGYPSDGLPPRRIETKEAPDGWYVGFLTEGSGVRGVIEARCYFVSHAEEVALTGRFEANGALPAETIHYPVCSPLLPLY